MTRNLYETDWRDSDFKIGQTLHPHVIVKPIRREDISQDAGVSLAQDYGPLSVMVYQVVSASDIGQVEAGDYVVCCPAIDAISPQLRYSRIHCEEIIHVWKPAEWAAIMETNAQ